MPIPPPPSQMGEPVLRNGAKSGGRKIATNVGNGGGGAGMTNHQMRYRQQKTSSSNGAGGNNTIDLT